MKENYNVLIVEDDEQIRDGIEIYLKSQGYQVLKACDGVEGLEVIRRENIHLAIVDVMRDLTNKSLKLPREIRKDEAKLTALMLIFTEHMKEAPLYKIINGEFIPIPGKDISYLNNLYVHMINYAYMMDCEDFAKYMNAKLNEQFEKLYDKNPIKLN